MGRGNYCPGGQVADQWYIDYDGYRWNDEEHHDYEIDEMLLDFDIDTILNAVKERFPSFSTADKYGDGYWAEHIRLENRFFRIGTADNQWSCAVFIQMKDDLWPEEENLARHHFQRYCDGIKAIMLDHLGEISLRCGAWCSRTLKKEEVLAV